MRVRLRCPRCQTPLDHTARRIVCPGCKTDFERIIFPAAAREDAAVDGGVLTSESDASCFYHPAKPAKEICAECGRYLCALCDVDLLGRHLCPACIGSGQKKEKIKDLANRRIRYDEIALSLTILPAVFIWPSLVTAPIALFLAIKHWNPAPGPLPVSKISNVLAILFSLFQIVLWILIPFVFFFK